MIYVTLIYLAIYSLQLADSQQISRDGACDLSTDRETVVKPTTVKYNFAYSASTISPRLLYENVVNDFTDYANIFSEEVGTKLADEYPSLGAADVTTIRFRKHGHTELALVDFIVSCEKNVTHDVITRAMRNVSKNTDYIDLKSLMVYANVIYCLRQEFQTKVGTFTWPITSGGTTVTTEESCSEESINGVEYKLAVRNCLKLSDGSAFWDSFQCTDCGGASAGYLLQQLYESLPNGDSAEELMRQVANITEMTDSIRVGGIEAVVNIVEYVKEETPSSLMTMEFVDELVRVVHNIQQMSSKTVTDAQGTSSTSFRLLRALHNILTSMRINSNSYSSIQDSIAVHINEYNNSNHELLWFQFGIFQSPSTDSTFDSGDFTIKENQLQPRAVGNTMVYVQNMEGIENYRRIFLLHQNDILFRSATDEIRLSAENSQYVRMINTRIVSVFGSSDNIGQPRVNAYFQPIKVKNKTKNEECQTWDWNEGDNGQGGWTEQGCSGSMEGEHFHCSCNRFSSFAVAMDVYEVPIEIYPDYVISRVGSSLAAILLLLTVLIFVFLKDLRKSKPHQILANLFLSLAIWHLFFVIGISQTNNRGVCAAFGIIMHYALLVSLCWMIVGAIDIYIVFVKARALPVKRFVLNGTILSWGVPLIIVVIVASIDLDFYREENKHCFLVNSPAVAFIATLIVPVFAAVCSVSIVYYMAWTMPVRRLNGDMEDEGDPMFRKRQQARILVLASSVIVILGIVTSIFGFIAIFSASTGTEIVFLLLCILEGSAIFGTCCVWPSEVRYLWLKKLGVLKSNPTKQGLFRPYWSLSKWTSRSVLPTAEPQFFLDNSVSGNGIITPQNIVLETFPASELSKESKA